MSCTGSGSCFTRHINDSIFLILPITIPLLRYWTIPLRLFKTKDIFFYISSTVTRCICLYACVCLESCQETLCNAPVRTCGSSCGWETKLTHRICTVLRMEEHASCCQEWHCLTVVGTHTFNTSTQTYTHRPRSWKKHSEFYSVQSFKASGGNRAFLMVLSKKTFEKTFCLVLWVLCVWHVCFLIRPM